MRIIEDASEPAAHLKTVTVELTGLDIAILHRAVSGTSTSDFNVVAHRLGIDAEVLSHADDELFSAPLRAASTIGLYK